MKFFVLLVIAVAFASAQEITTAASGTTASGLLNGLDLGGLVKKLLNLVIQLVQTLAKELGGLLPGLEGLTGTLSNLPVVGGLLGGGSGDNGGGGLLG